MSHTILDRTDEKIVLVDAVRMIVLDCLGNVAELPFAQISLTSLPATCSISSAESPSDSWPVNVYENSSPGSEGDHSARWRFFSLPVYDLFLVAGTPANGRLLDMLRAQREG